MDWTASQIVALRERLGLNQREFARILGVDPGNLGMWELAKAEPSPCYETLLTFISEHQEAAERLMSYPIQERHEPMSERLERLEEKLGINRKQIAQLLTVNPSAVYSWTTIKASNPQFCAQRKLDWLEHHFEEAAPYFWPDLLISEDRRIANILEATGLTKDELEDLTGLPTFEGKLTDCSFFILDFLELYGAEGVDLIRSLDLETPWSSERVVAARENANLSRKQLERLIGTNIPYYETFGLGQPKKTNLCHRIFYTLLEQHANMVLAVWQS